MSEAKKAVCLCSGGMDSAIAATIAKQAGYSLHLFHANYGQKAEMRELEAVEKIGMALGAEDLICVDVGLFRNLSALTQADAAIPMGDAVDLNATASPPTWVYCRNLVLVSLAAAYAEYLGARKIYVGFNAEEAQSYPDNRPEFVDIFNQLLQKSVASFSSPPTIVAPLINMFKAEIVKKGTEVKAPLSLSWSCYLNGERHCGLCESCQHRRRGFREAEVVDPTEYA